MPRKPKGTYIRDTADWFYKSRATVGYLFTPADYPSFTNLEVALYNDDMQGRLLRIDGIDLIDTTSTDYVAYHAQGVNGSKVSDSVPVYSGMGKLAGALYVYNGPTIFPNMPFPTPSALALDMNLGFGGMAPAFQPIAGRGPIAVVKQGYSYRINQWGQSGPLWGVNFYYTVLEG